MVRLKILAVVVLLFLSGPSSGLDKEEKEAIKAIRVGDMEALKVYLEKHPDKNCSFSNGKTGLYYAIVHDQAKICLFLLKRGADPEFNIDGSSTLYWAIKHDRARIVRLLIEYGAEVNRKDEKENTPLIYAAELNNLEMCKILVDRGANPMHENLKGKKASDFALNYYEPVASDYLLFFEKLYQRFDTVPSMNDGPYIYRENDDRMIMAYFERNTEKKLTRIIEKTLETGKEDTVVGGFGWDKNTYHILNEIKPNPYEVQTDGEIFAIGDIHGRYDALINLLANNKVIDQGLNWNFGNGQLVFLGDVFDRGSLVTEVLWFLYHLQIQAQQAGGNLHLLLGNHEVMTLTGDHRYLDFKYDFFTQYFQVYYFQLYENNTVLGNWLRNKNLVAEINGYLFVHAGISPQFAAMDYAFDEVNSVTREYLNSDFSLVKGSSEEFILGPFGPLWYRGYGNYGGGSPEVSQEFADSLLSAKGLKRMVLGHNEQLDISTSLQGKVISIDVKIDESGKSAKGLLISGDNIYKCLSDGTREKVE